MFISETSPSVLCMYKFVCNLFYLCYISFLSARVAADSIKRVCASGWFMQMVNNNYTPTLTNVFKNILKTFGVEMLKIFKNS